MQMLASPATRIPTMPFTTNFYSVFDDAELRLAGLNLQAVIAVSELPEALQIALGNSLVGTPPVKTLLLFGNGGPAFWQAYQGFQTTDPHSVDAFSRHLVTDFMKRCWPATDYRFLYPGSAAVPLQALGQHVGWHHDSPMKVGINDTWGLWYAYRALVALADEWEPSRTVPSVSPCLTCHDKPCIKACPPKALDDQQLRLERCIDFRLLEGSVCSHQCLARGACPIAPEQRYSQDQIQYHYGHSLPCLRQWRTESKGRA